MNFKICSSEILEKMTSNIEKVKEKLRASYERINRMQHVVSKVEMCKDTLKMKMDEINDQLSIMATDLFQKLQSIQEEIEQTVTKTMEDHLAKLNAVKERVLSGNAFLMQVCMDAEGLLKGRSDELLGRAFQKIFSRFEEAWQQLDLEEGVDLGNMVGIVFFNNAEEFLNKTYLASLTQVDKHGMVLSKQLFWVKKSVQTGSFSPESSTGVNFEKPVKFPNSGALQDSNICKQVEIIPELPSGSRACKNQEFGTQKKKSPLYVRIRAIDLCQAEEDTRIRSGDCKEIKKVTSESDIALPPHASSTLDIADGKEYKVTKGCRNLQKSSSSELQRCSDKKSPGSSNEMLCDLFRYLPERLAAELWTVDTSNSSSTPSGKAGGSSVSSSPDLPLKVASITGGPYVQDPKLELQIYNEFELDLEEDFVWESDEEQEAANKRTSGLTYPSGDTIHQSKSQSEIIDTVEQEFVNQMPCSKPLQNNKLQHEGDTPDSMSFPGSQADKGIERSIPVAGSSFRNVALTNHSSVPQSGHKLSKPCSVNEDISANSVKLPAQATDINIVDYFEMVSSELQSESQIQETDSDTCIDSKTRLVPKVSSEQQHESQVQETDNDTCNDSKTMMAPNVSSERQQESQVQETDSDTSIDSKKRLASKVLSEWQQESQVKETDNDAFSDSKTGLAPKVSSEWQQEYQVLETDNDTCNDSKRRLASKVLSEWQQESQVQKTDSDTCIDSKTRLVPKVSSEQQQESQVQKTDSDTCIDSKRRLGSKIVVVTHSQSKSPSSPRFMGLSQQQLDIRSYMVHVGDGFFEAYAKCIGKIRECFHFPIGVCTNSTGAVIVADTGNNVIKVCQNGRVTQTFGQKLARPSAVVVNKKDEIFVKDDRCIHHYDPQGNLIKKIGSKNMHMPYGLAMTQDGQLVVVDTFWQKPCLLLFTEDGQLTSHPYQPLLTPSIRSKCRFLAVYKEDMLTSDLGLSCLYLTNLKGELDKTLGRRGSRQGEMCEPSGIACDDVGNWIVADSKNDRLQVFALPGFYLCQIVLSEPIRRPSGIHLSPDGLLYIINYLDGIIKVFKFCEP